MLITKTIRPDNKEDITIQIFDNEFSTVPMFNKNDHCSEFWDMYQVVKNHNSKSIEDYEPIIIAQIENRDEFTVTVTMFDDLWPEEYIQTILAVKELVGDKDIKILRG